MDEAPMQETISRFLDDLRADGRINMFGAAPVVAETFGLDSATAKRMTVHWMENFGKDA